MHHVVKKAQYLGSLTREVGKIVIDEFGYILNALSSWKI